MDPPTSVGLDTRCRTWLVYVLPAVGSELPPVMIAVHKTPAPVSARDVLAFYKYLGFNLMILPDDGVHTVRLPEAVDRTHPTYPQTQPKSGGADAR